MKNKSEKLKFFAQPYGFGKAIFLAFLIAFAGFFVQSILQNGFFSYMHFVYLIYPHIIILNILPIFIIVMLCYFITNRLWVGTIISYIPLVAINLVNFYKVLFRDEPFKISDIQLAGEMGDITQNYEIRPTFGVIIGVILAIAITVFVIKKFKTVPIKWSFKVVGAVLCIALLGLSYQFVYTNKKLYEAMPVFGIEYHDSSVVKHKGALYSFLISGQAAKYSAPEEYSKETAENILKEHTVTEVSEKSEEKINVIAIMSEAFFYMNDCTNVQYENNVNPYENYERIKKESYFGDLIVGGFGGGTECPEFEFLTGTNLYLLDSSMPTAYKTYINQDTYSLVRKFKDEGYYTLAIHPGNAWFYNRQNAYPYLGFDEYLTKVDMDEDAPKIYGYIEDEYTTEQIINNYTKHFEENPDMPYFNFTVTIQNHGPYPALDYGRDSVYKRPEGISDENYYIINNYLNGVVDADELLGDICEFAEGREEPVVVLWFGDHLPYLDGETVCYDILDYNIDTATEEGAKNKYCTEYLLWSNSSAKKIIEKNSGNVKVGEGQDISSNYLGAELLDYMGVEKGPYFEFVQAAEDKLNVIGPRYFQKENLRKRELNEQENALIKEYRILQYYNLRGYKK